MTCQPYFLTKVYQWLKNQQSCLLCSAPSARALALCEACEADLPWLGSQCLQCALPIPDQHALCTECTHTPPFFSKVIAPFEYIFPVDTLINRFKHQQNWPYGKLLSHLLGHYLNYYYDEGGLRPDYIVAVPLAKQRQQKRGYNQAQILCDWLSKELKLVSQPQLIRRTRETQSQQGLTAQERQKNLQYAFHVPQPERIKNKHIVLVDDVLTTGTTCSTISSLLLEHGAAWVEVYCLARTPKPSKYRLSP